MLKDRGAQRCLQVQKEERGRDTRGSTAAGQGPSHHRPHCDHAEAPPPHGDPVSPSAHSPSSLGTEDVRGRSAATCLQNEASRLLATQTAFWSHSRHRLGLSCVWLQAQETQPTNHTLGSLTGDPYSDAHQSAKTRTPTEHTPPPSAQTSSGSQGSAQLSSVHTSSAMPPGLVPFP